MILDRLKNVNLERSDLDEIVELLAFGNMMFNGYGSVALEAPDWLKEAVDTLRKEAASRTRDNKLAALKQARLRMEKLKTADQKREETAAEIKRLETELGG